MEEINEALGNTIAHPILAGKAQQAFTTELKRWKEAEFITKWQKNKFFSKVRIYVKGIDQPYVINITHTLGKKDQEGETAKEKFKSRLIGKVKSPFRFFHTFNNWGYYEIVEKLFDIIEDDVDKGKPQKKKGLDLDSDEAQKFEADMAKSMAEAKRKVSIFKQIDKGNFAITMSEEIVNEIRKNSGIINETNKDKEI